MGAWSTALFGSDLACDLREQWKNLYAASPSPRDAAKALIHDCKSTLRDPDEAAEFWLVLAALQWRYGCLSPANRRRAVGIINRRAGLDRCGEESESDARQRIRVYDQLKAKLLSPQPKLRKVRKVVLEETPFKRGQLLRLDAKPKRSFLLWAVAHRRHRGAKLMMFVVFPWKRAADPSRMEFSKLRPLIYDVQAFQNKWAEKQRAADPPLLDNLEEYLRFTGYDRPVSFSTVMPPGSHDPGFPPPGLRVLPGKWSRSMRGRPGGPTDYPWPELPRVLLEMYQLPQERWR